jgi:hypothetical protein
MNCRDGVGKLSSVSLLFDPPVRLPTDAAMLLQYTGLRNASQISQFDTFSLVVLFIRKFLGMLD